MIKAVIFDLFGVVITDGFHAVLRKLDETNPEARAYITPLIHRVIEGELSVKESSEEIAKYLGISYEQWRRMINNNEYKDPRMLDLIKQLRKSYKTGLLSNVGKGGIEQRLTTEEIADCFDVAIASAEVGLIKPQHEIYELAAARLGVEPNECVFVDDIERFCTAAKEVGMQAIWFQSFEQMKAELDALLVSNLNN